MHNAKLKSRRARGVYHVCCLLVIVAFLFAFFNDCLCDYLDYCTFVHSDQVDGRLLNIVHDVSSTKWGDVHTLHIEAEYTVDNVVKRTSRLSVSPRPKWLDPEYAHVSPILTKGNAVRVMYSRLSPELSYVQTSADSIRWRRVVRECRAFVIIASTVVALYVFGGVYSMRQVASRSA